MVALMVAVLALLLNTIGSSFDQNRIYPVNVLFVLLDNSFQKDSDSFNLVNKLVTELFVSTINSEDTKFKPNQISIHSYSTRKIPAAIICEDATCVNELLKKIKIARTVSNEVSWKHCVDSMSNLGFSRKWWGDSSRLNYSKLVVFVGGWQIANEETVKYALARLSEFKVFFYILPKDNVTNDNATLQDKSLPVLLQKRADILYFHVDDEFKGFVQMILTNMCNNEVEMKIDCETFPNKANCRSHGTTQTKIKNELVVDDMCKQNRYERKKRQDDEESTVVSDGSTAQPVESDGISSDVIIAVSVGCILFVFILGFVIFLIMDALRRQRLAREGGRSQNMVMMISKTGSGQKHPKRKDSRRRSIFKRRKYSKTEKAEPNPEHDQFLFNSNEEVEVRKEVEIHKEADVHKSAKEAAFDSKHAKNKIRGIGVCLDEHSGDANHVMKKEATPPPPPPRGRLQFINV